MIDFNEDELKEIVTLIKISPDDETALKALKLCIEKHKEQTNEESTLKRFSEINHPLDDYSLKKAEWDIIDITKGCNKIIDKIAELENKIKELTNENNKQA